MPEIAEIPAQSHPHAALIEKLGGVVSVQERLNRRLNKRLTTQAISMMKRRGIAWRYRAALAEELKAAGIPVPTDFLTA